VIESIGRGVLDHPLSRVMTWECLVRSGALAKMIAIIFAMPK